MNKEKEKMYKDYKDTYCTEYINRYTFEFDFLPNVLPSLKIFLIYLYNLIPFVKENILYIKILYISMELIIPMIIE